MSSDVIGMKAAPVLQPLLVLPRPAGIAEMMTWGNAKAV